MRTGSTNDRSDRRRRCARRRLAGRARPAPGQGPAGPGMEVGRRAILRAAPSIVLRAGDPPAQTLSLVAGLALDRSGRCRAAGPAAAAQMAQRPVARRRQARRHPARAAGDRVVVGFGVNLAGAPELAGRRPSPSTDAVTPAGLAPLLARQWRGCSNCGAPRRHCCSPRLACPRPSGRHRAHGPWQ